MKNKILNSLLLFLLITILPQTLLAIPASPYPVKVKQPNGEEISVYQKGDEKVHWMESEDGYTLMLGTNKEIVYATLNTKGDMIPSDIVYTENNLRSSSTTRPAGITKGLRYSQSQIEIMNKIWEIEDTEIKKASPLSLRSSDAGQAKQINAVCALIGFPDKPFSKTAAEFEQMMNQIGYSVNGSHGSVRDFYKENSYGQIDMIITVVGPYTAKKNWKFYGENGSSGSDSNSRVLAEEAAKFAFTDPQVNPSDYDNDDDGYIDAFHFIFAGNGEESGGGMNPDAIWSHKWNFQTRLQFSNKYLDTYSCSPELAGNTESTITAIGVICHEMCHVFGSPDYYDTNYNTGGKFNGTGNWDLMSNGNYNNDSKTPAHINMYQKIQFGWVTPVELTSETPIENMPNSAENPVAYIYKTNTEGEFYVLENRQKTGFDSHVPGHGLLIYHVGAGAKGRSVSNTTHPQQVYPVCASSNYKTPTSDPASYGSINSAGCPFPGTSEKRAFTDHTTPSAIDWAGNYTGKPLTKISETNDGLISFHFMESGIPVSNVRASVDGQTVNLYWDAPEGSIIGYSIYRNNQLQASINDPSATSFTFYNVGGGTYNYCVSAISDGFETTPACAEVTVEGPATDCDPVKSLKGSATGDQISLSWEPAFDGWISHSGDQANTLSFGAKGVCEIATRFTKEDLNGLEGMILDKIRFYTGATNRCFYTVSVRKSIPGGIPGAPLFEEEVFGSFSMQEKEVTPTTPIIIEKGMELWLCIKYNTSLDNLAVIMTDAGPRVAGRNYMFMNGRWSEFTDSGLDYNWCISGFIRNADSSKAMQNPGTTEMRASIASAYKVYRDGSLLGSVTETSYTDKDVAYGKHIYSVSAICDGNESEHRYVEATSKNLNVPVRNLNAASNDKGNISLSWIAPEAEKPMTYISAGDTKIGYIGYSNNNPINVTLAARWEGDKIKDIQGYKLTKVAMIPGSEGTVCSYTVMVWESGENNQPGTLLLEQAITQELKNIEWNTIVLDKPIDTSRGLWIGINCNASSGSPLTYFPSETHTETGHCDLVYINGSWMTLPELNSDFFGKCAVRGRVELPNNPDEFVIYRDNKYLTSTTDLSFEDKVQDDGAYKYGVSAKYGSKESLPAEAWVSVTITGIRELLTPGMFNVFPNPVTRGETINIQFNESVTNAELSLYSLSGTLIRKESVNGQEVRWKADLVPGVYILSIKKDHSSANLKIIVK